MELYEEIQALLVLTFQTQEQYSLPPDKFRESLDRLNNEQLEHQKQFMTAYLSLIKEHVSLKVDIKDIITIYKNAQARFPSSFLLLPKWYIDGFLFDKYEHTLKQWPLFPMGALVLIRPDRIYKGPQKMEVIITEAAFFTDACLLYNKAKELEEKYPDSLNTPKEFVKENRCYLRSSLVSSYNFVEAYLNSIAFDCYLKYRDTLNADEVEKLTERNFKTGSSKYLTLKDKIQQYPRIFLRTSNPPIHVNQDKRISELIEMSKQFRDSIVHMSPMPVYTKGEIDFGKVGGFAHLNLKILTKVLDNCIYLVKKVNEAIQRTEQHISWLSERNQVGYFDLNKFS